MLNRQHIMKCHHLTTHGYKHLGEDGAICEFLYMFEVGWQLISPKPLQQQRQQRLVDNY